MYISTIYSKIHITDYKSLYPQLRVTQYVCVEGGVGIVQVQVFHALVDVKEIRRNIRIDFIYLYLILPYRLSFTTNNARQFLDMSKERKIKPLFQQESRRFLSEH